MSQNSRNEHSERHENSGPGTGREERKNSMGFEGMNYEQRRQPFNPKPMSNNRSEREDSKGRRNENNR